MAFKVVAFAALLAVARASNIGYGAISAYSGLQHHVPALHGYASPLAYGAHASPVAHVAHVGPIAKTVIAEPSAPAHYDYGYAVSDPLTGDHKSQQESRRGDVVQGSYSLLDSDGTKRTVEYSADEHNGFNAVVHKEPLAVHAPVVAKVAAPVIAKIATPVAHAYAAPHAYAGPAVAHGYSASVVSHGVAAPALAHGYVAPGLAHGYATPALAHGYAASTLAHGYAAPALAHGYAAHVPALSYSSHYAPAW